MLDDFNRFLKQHECLLNETTSSNGARRFPLRIPDLPNGRAIDSAWIDIPNNFFDSGLATIWLPKKYILEIPHVESDGRLCIDGDPGPLSGGTPRERIDQLIDTFYSTFLDPWSRGDLDNHFAKEAMSYWAIHYSRSATSTQPVVKVFTTDPVLQSAKVYKSRFIENRRIVIAGEDSIIRSRYANSLSDGTTISSVIVAEIPITYPFIPDNWPKNIKDIQRLITIKLGANEAKKFLKSEGRKGRAIHKIVVFRAPGCSFGYLLPGGPCTIIKKGKSVKSYPNRKLIPLKVERLDVSWTTGRDQHPEYFDRQLKHVLIIGVGALGSPIAEQLAKSGIGKITLVDDDMLSAANIGRHTLGANSIGSSKVDRLAQSISVRWPSCYVLAFHLSFQQWLKANSLVDVDMILDLTGEPGVRLRVDQERRKHNVDLLIAWMEPFVVSAHACLLPVGSFWVAGGLDRLKSLNAVDWPDGVMLNEPACSSSFQSYTSAAATHAVALTLEAALDLIDKKMDRPIVRHWIRGKQYLDECYAGLQYNDWAREFANFQGLILEKPL